MDRLTYRVHQNLLAQVADTEEEAREVRRILTGVAIRAIDGAIDAQIYGKERAWPSCCGNCSQGRRLCPTPDACQVSIEPDPPREPAGYAGLFVFALLLTFWAAVAAMAIAWFAN